MVIFFDLSPTSNHLHPLQVENCDSNSRLVVDEDDNGKLRLARVNMPYYNFAVLSLDLKFQVNKYYYTCWPIISLKR